MAVLPLAEKVVTGELLQKRHEGQEEVCFAPGAIVTPTAWDYIRQKRLRVSRGEAAAAPAPAAGETIQEVQPPRLVCEGRCEHPGRSCGCQTEEFGSGFVEPSSCRDCAIYHLKREGRPNAGCEGCNRYRALQEIEGGREGLEAEELVQHITRIVSRQLGV